MCLVAFALDVHSRHRLVLVGNRDEAFDRPAAPLAVWEKPSGIVAGRDLVAGGTWLGVADGQRWGVLTNVRDPRNPRPSVRSRGELVADYLRGKASALDYARDVFERLDTYEGFNLVVGDADDAVVVSTRTDAVTVLGSGVYGLSNDRLDTPWPKLVRARTSLRAALDSDPVSPADLLDLMDDTAVADDAALPDTGVGLALERVLSATRIVTPDYGTRVTTALTLDVDGGGQIVERTWTADGEPGDTVTVDL